MSTDQFFTRPEVAAACWRRLTEEVRDEGDVLWIEPSVGGQALWRHLPADRRLGFELDPAYAVDGVRQADFLKLVPMLESWPGDRRVIVFSNPPFGPRSRLAVAFIQKCFELGADAGGFIVPASVFRRRIEGCHLARRWSFESEQEAFALPDGRRCKVLGCGFGIWRRGPDPAERKEEDASEFVEVWTTALRGGRNAGAGRLDEADWFINTRCWSNGELSLLDRFEDAPYGVAYAIRAKKQRALVEEILRRTDWRKFARRCLDGGWGMNVGVIHRALLAGGVRDGVLPLDLHSVNAASGAGLDVPADRFIRRSTYQSTVRKEGGIHARKTPPPNAAVAVRVRPGADRGSVLAGIDAIDFAPYGRRSVSTSTELDNEAVKAALRDALLPRVWNINRGKGLGLDPRPGAIYFPHYAAEGSVRKGWLRAYDEVISNEMVGVSGPSVLARLRGLHPELLGRRSTNGGIAVSVESVREAIERINDVEVIHLNHKEACWERRAECQGFVPLSVFYGQDAKLAFTSEPPARCCMGVLIRDAREHARLTAWARAFDWRSIARRQANRNLNLLRADVLREFRRA